MTILLKPLASLAFSKEFQKVHWFHSLLGVLLFFSFSASAQVLDVNQFKIISYTQTSSNPPAGPNVPDTYFFGCYADTDGTVVDGVMYIPGMDGTNLVQGSSNYFSFNSSYFSNTIAFDTNFPGGDYEYDFDYLDSGSNLVTQYVFFTTSTSNLYSDTVPAFTPDCWNGMQAVDPSQSFLFNWNAYKQTDGTDLAYTFLTVSGAGTNVSLLYDGPFAQTSTNLAPNQLAYGTRYSVNLYFSERQTFNSDGARIVAGWDRSTTAYLTTIAPSLSIAAAGSNVSLSWPFNTTNYVLQSTANLAGGSNSWSVVTNIPGTNANGNSLTLPALNAGAFFRLAPAK